MRQINHCIREYVVHKSFFLSSVVSNSTKNNSYICEKCVCRFDTSIRGSAQIVNTETKN